jgi:acyl carrier protein
LQLLRAFVPSLPQHENEASSIKLQDAGLVSMVAVKLMLSLEAEFKIEIADHELTPENFATLDAIVALVARARSQ